MLRFSFSTSKQRPASLRASIHEMNNTAVSRVPIEASLLRLSYWRLSTHWFMNVCRSLQRVRRIYPNGLDFTMTGKPPPTSPNSRSASIDLNRFLMRAPCWRILPEFLFWYVLLESVRVGTAWEVDVTSSHGSWLWQKLEVKMRLCCNSCVEKVDEAIRGMPGTVFAHPRALLIYYMSVYDILGNFGFLCTWYSGQ